MKSIFIIVSSFLLSISAVSAEVQIKGYNTYTLPPYLYEDGSGLANTLVNHLNKTLKGQTNFVLNNLPRARLVKYDLKTDGTFSDVVLFLNPGFVNDEKEELFNWSKVIFISRNVIITNRLKKLSIQTSEDLKGLRFSAIAGHRNIHLEDKFKNGTIKKLDASSEENCLRQVLSGHSDFTQMNQSQFDYLMSTPEFAKAPLKFTFLKEEAPFERRILVGKAVPAGVLNQINSSLEALYCDKEWKALSKKYSFTMPVCNKKLN